MGNPAGGAQLEEFFRWLGPAWPLSDAQRERLALAVGSALGLGWQSRDLAAFVGANTGGVRNPYAVLESRLRPGELPAPPAPVPRRKPWCGRCDEQTRLLDEEFRDEFGTRSRARRCPDCGASARAQIPPGRQPRQARRREGTGQLTATAPKALARNATPRDLYGAHELPGYWLHAGLQAARKGSPAGRAAPHATGHHVNWRRATAALALDAVSHYALDRREPLRKLAGLLDRTRPVPGKANFWQLGQPRPGRQAPQDPRRRAPRAGHGPPQVHPAPPDLHFFRVTSTVDEKSHES